MIILKKKADLAGRIVHKRQNGSKIGFVPTMGALHEGHMTLFREAARHSDMVVCSIFVNPTQFNDPADFEKYPVTLEKDISALISSGVTLLFLPSVAEMYPGGTQGLETYPLGPLESVYEGRYRPGHFQGVCQVMDRLLEAVRPDFLFMGQKDYQQCMVVAELLAYRQSTVQLNVVPTVREADGLAMSSRNLRLSAEERLKSTGIFRALYYMKQRLQTGELGELKGTARRILDQHGFRTDYLDIADADTLQPVENWDGMQRLVALAAATQGDVRLIDNLLLTT